MGFREDIRVHMYEVDRLADRSLQNKSAIFISKANRMSYSRGYDIVLIYQSFIGSHARKADRRGMR